MARLYHNNQKVIDMDKIGRNGQRMSRAIDEYLSKEIKKSEKGYVHIFKFESKTFTHIFAFFYNPKTLRWNYKTVAKF